MTDKFMDSVYVLPGSKAHKFLLASGHKFKIDLRPQFIDDCDGYTIRIACKETLLVSGFTSGKSFHKFLKAHDLV